MRRMPDRISWTQAVSPAGMRTGAAPAGPVMAVMPRWPPGRAGWPTTEAGAEGVRHVAPSGGGSAAGGGVVQPGPAPSGVPWCLARCASSRGCRPALAA